MKPNPRKDEKARKRRDREKIATDLAEYQKSVEKSQKVYADEWTVDAAHFSKGGHYAWMASFLSCCDRILEVGTGEGSGTLALCKNGAVVVSVEENPYCLERARLNLLHAGIPVETKRRGRFVPELNGKFRTVYDKPQFGGPLEGALLVEGDLLSNDPDLIRWIQAVSPFDGIACWNIGTYFANAAMCGGIQEYRLKVQNYVYVLADAILRPGGLLHIVDRGKDESINQEKIAKAFIVGVHEDQASVTSVKVDAGSVSIRPYDPPTDGAGIKMMTGGSTGKPMGSEGLVLYSILARKP